MKHLLSILGIMASSAPCANYYLDGTSGSDAGSGTMADPWKSLSKVPQKMLVPGDSILLRRGAIWAKDSLFLAATGAADRPIVVSAYGNPLLAKPHVSSPGRLIVLNKSRQIVLENLELSGARGGGVEMWDSTNTGIVVQGLEVHDCGGGIYMTGTDITVRNNFVHDGRMVVNTQATMDDDYGATGINLGQIDGAKVYGNRLVDLVAPSYDYGVDGGAVEIWRTVRHAEIFGNFAYRADGFSEFGGLAGDSIVDLSVHHNIVLDSKVLACFHIASAKNLFGVGYDRVRYDHNLVVLRREPPWGHFIIADGSSLDRADRIQVRNNLFVSDSITMLSYEQGRGKDPSWVHSDNLFWIPKYDPLKDGLTAGPGDAYGDPLFAGPNWSSPALMDTAIGSFTLRPGSPAAGKGPDLGYAADFFGNPVARGGVADLGPLAVGSTAGVGWGSAIHIQRVPVDVRALPGGLEIRLALDSRTRLSARLLDAGGRPVATWQDWTAESGTSIRILPIEGDAAGARYLSIQAEGFEPASFPLGRFR